MDTGTLSRADDQPLRVRYSLTEDGRALAPVIEALEAWGESRRS